MPGSPRATNDEDAFRLAPGTKVPPVTLPATDGTAVDLAALQGRSVVVVYPWTGRPGIPNPPDWDRIPGAHGSTPELEGFRDRHSEFMRLGVRICGLSRQSTDYQCEMATRLRLPFVILSDAEGTFAGALPGQDISALKGSEGVTVIEQDVSSTDSVKKSAEQVAAAVGKDGLHLLINNAGIANVAQGFVEVLPERQEEGQPDRGRADHQHPAQEFLVDPQASFPAFRSYRTAGNWSPRSSAATSSSKPR